MLQLPLNIQLDDSAKFANFLSAANEQLVSRLQSLNASTDDFVFIWGSTQTGKTHLAQALCHGFNQLGLSAAYLPLDNSELNAGVLEGMSFMDLVCIDNLEYVTSKPEWEIALFDLYNNLKLESKSLVIFSHGAPSSLPIQLPDLQSRLNAMEIYRLEGLDDEQKIELFLSRASNRGLEISEDVIRFIFSRYSRSLGDLMEILEKLDHSSIALKRKITIPLVKEILD